MASPHCVKARVMDNLVAALFVFVCILGPWTKFIAKIFGFNEWTETSAYDMAVYMLSDKMVPSFARGAPLFIGVPVIALVIRACSSRAAYTVQRAFLLIGGAVSVCALPLLFMTNKTDRVRPNVMGEVFTADAISMWIVHVVLCFHVRVVPAWSVALGPSFGLVLFLVQKSRDSSIVMAIIVLYANVGSLYRAYRILEVFDINVLTQTIPADEWNGYEIYSLMTVVSSFVIICTSIPTPQNRLELAETVLYIVLLNANVASAWATPRGFFRRPLV